MVSTPSRMYRILAGPHKLEDIVKRKIGRSLAPVIILMAALIAPAQPAAAADPFIVPAGIGCADFNLGITTSGGNLHTKEFFDAEGNLVRIITAGKGVLLTWTNYGTDPDNPVEGESITIRTDGSVSQTRVNADGTYTVTAMGHNGIVFFPTDVPAGPRTTQYTGRVVYNVDPATGVFTLISSSGQELDICAELS